MKKFKIFLSMFIVMICCISLCACDIALKKDKTNPDLNDLVNIDVVLDQTYCVSTNTGNVATNLSAKNVSDTSEKLYFKVLSGEDNEIAVIYGDRYTVGTYQKTKDSISATFKFGGDEEEEESEEEIERTISIQLDGDEVKINETTETSDKIVPDNITIEPVEDKVLEDGCYTLETMKWNGTIQEDSESGVIFIKNGRAYTNDDPTFADILKIYYLGNQMFYKCYSGVTGEYAGYGENLFIIEKPQDHDQAVAAQISTICGYDVSNLTWFMSYEGEDEIYYHIYCTQERLESSEVYQQFKNGLLLEQDFYLVDNNNQTINNTPINFIIFGKTSLNLKNDGTFTLSVAQSTKKQLSKVVYVNGYHNIIINEDAQVGDVIEIDAENNYTVTQADLDAINGFNKTLNPFIATGKWYITYHGVVCEFDEPTVLGTVFGVGEMGSLFGDTLASRFYFENQDESYIEYDLYWQEKTE